MPIVELEFIDDNPEPIDATSTQRLADCLGRLFDAHQGATWIRWRVTPRRRYAENDQVLPHAAAPTFVHVLKAERPTGVKLAEEAREIARIVSQVSGRPQDNVHVLFEPDASGRIAFGGVLRD